MPNFWGEKGDERSRTDGTVYQELDLLFRWPDPCLVSPVVSRNILRSKMQALQDDVLVHIADQVCGRSCCILSINEYRLCTSTSGYYAYTAYEISKARRSNDLQDCQQIECLSRQSLRLNRKWCGRHWERQLTKRWKRIQQYVSLVWTDCITYLLPIRQLRCLQRSIGIIAKPIVKILIRSKLTSDCGWLQKYKIIDLHTAYEWLKESLDLLYKVERYTGEDVGHYGGSYKVTYDLYKKYGEMRLLDTPICGELFLYLDGTSKSINIDSWRLQRQDCVKFMPYLFTPTVYCNPTTPVILRNWHWLS